MRVCRCRTEQNFGLLSRGSQEAIKVSQLQGLLPCSSYPFPFIWPKKHEKVSNNNFHRNKRLRLQANLAQLKNTILPSESCISFSWVNLSVAVYEGGSIVINFSWSDELLDTLIFSELRDC